MPGMSPPVVMAVNMLVPTNVLPSSGTVRFFPLTVTVNAALRGPATLGANCTQIEHCLPTDSECPVHLFAVIRNSPALEPLMDAAPILCLPGPWLLITIGWLMLCAPTETG